MKKVIYGGKTSPMQESDNGIGFRGEVHDYILVTLITLFVLGFFILRYS